MLKSLLLTLTFALTLIASPPPADDSSAVVPQSQRLGIVYISQVADATNPERYRQAQALGAGWNRWPLYWDHIQPAPQTWAWAAYDQLVAGDLAHGFNINAILLGRPPFYQDDERITGLNEPAFSDGTDTPASGKTPNPANPWAVYVWEAVNRYKPGGALARLRGWDDNKGIRVWEVWNEPDHKPFWEGTIRDYARLLKVTYLVAKLADPEAQVMFGGLLYSTPDNWLARVLAIYINDPLREQHNWYMDMVGVHSYSYPRRSGWLTLYVRETLKAYGLKRPIWLTETGVPVWDDYPGPLWTAASPQERVRHATSAQQAAFVIQSAAYAWAEGAEVIFFHQLYDDCGNQPPGTNFPFHQGELCQGERACFGEAFGLLRNPSSSVCYSHHPQPDTPRPAAHAFQLLARVFGSVAHDAAAIKVYSAGATAIAFDRRQTGERIYVLWNRTFNALDFSLPAGQNSAALYALDDERQVQSSRDGFFRLRLPPATPDDYPDLEPGDVSPIGGPPLIVVERLGTEPARDVLARAVVQRAGQED
ncbi:MAG: hypothetical protein ACUVSX_05780 [Aggregatilineales bacterium]